MCLRLFTILWIDISFGLLVFNVCYGSLRQCKHCDKVLFQRTVVQGSKFEIPLCWQSKDYTIYYTAIDNNYFVKVNSNESNVWLASRANVRGHIGDQVIVFMINRLNVNDFKCYLVKFHPYGKRITIHVNLTKSETSLTTVQESTTRGSTVPAFTVAESTITESTITESTNINKFESVCEDDWQFIEKRCVKLFSGNSWSEAVTTCQEAGAKLTNGLFNRSVYKQDKPTWINTKNGTKCYLQKKKNISSEKGCNTFRNKYFCEKNVGVGGKCESTWQHVGDKCIQYFGEQTWTRAFNHCQNISADLTHGTLDYELYSEGSSQTWINKSDGSLCSLMQKNVYTEKTIPCNTSRNFFCEKFQDTPNVTHFNLQTYSEGVDISKQDLLKRSLVLISVDQQATSLMFTCNASGAHNVTIMNGEKIKATGNNSVTHQQSFEQTRCFESAEYSCVARNNFGVSKFSKNIQGTCKFRIQSFFASPKKSDVEKLFIAEVNDTGVTFQCTTNRVFESFLKILHKGNKLADTDTANVLYTIPQVQCRDMGEYVCKAEDVRKRAFQEEKIQLAVSNCEAQLCSSIDQSKPIKAKVHDNVTVSFCLTMYQETFEQPKLYLNETVIEQTELFNRYSWSLGFYGHLNKTINLHIQNIKPEDFGVQYINVEFNGRNTSLVLDIQAEGPPLCPTNLTIREIGSNDVIVSFRPGFNGGAEQKFSIIYKKMNETSQETHEVQTTNMDSFGRLYVTLDNLESDTTYEFRVTSTNRFGLQIEESGLCDVTMTGTTRTGAVSLEQQESKGDLHTGAMAVGGAAVVVIVVALVAVVIKKR
ncbi:unnamed protein product, partial [Lymnaea stagnalis]